MRRAKEFFSHYIKTNTQLNLVVLFQNGFDLLAVAA